MTDEYVKMVENAIRLDEGMDTRNIVAELADIYLKNNIGDGDGPTIEDYLTALVREVADTNKKLTALKKLRVILK